MELQALHSLESPGDNRDHHLICGWSSKYEGSETFAVVCHCSETASD